MTDIIKSIAHEYGTDKIHYGLITFDTKADIDIPFSSNIDSAEDLKSLIDIIPMETDGPAIDKALESAKTLFGGDGVRYDAQKVLVLMVDKKSSGDEEAAMKTAMELKESGVIIITVAVGDETDPNSLKNISSTPGNVVNTSTTDKPDEVGKEIIDKTGKEVVVSTLLGNWSHCCTQDERYITMRCLQAAPSFTTKHECDFQANKVPYRFMRFFYFGDIQNDNHRLATLTR